MHSQAIRDHSESFKTTLSKIGAIYTEYRSFYPKKAKIDPQKSERFAKSGIAITSIVSEEGVVRTSDPRYVRYILSV